MEITFLGHASFKLKGKKTTVVTDPYDGSVVGLKFPKVDADLVTISHDHADHNASKAVGGNPFVIHGPGEYEVAGVGVIGISTYHDSNKGSDRGVNTVYSLQIDGLRIVHAGDLGHMLTDKQIEELGECDILIVPVGGHYTIDAKQAQELVQEIEPSIVIPMHYQVGGLKEELKSVLSPVETFTKLFSMETVTPQPKLIVTKDKLPETMQLVVLGT